MPPSEDRAETDRRATKRCLGPVGMGVGGLIAGICGLCTVGYGGVYGVDNFHSLSHAGEARGPLVFRLSFEGLPIVILMVVFGLLTVVGVALFAVGRRMYSEGHNP